jgi:hypothetical protein
MFTRLRWFVTLLPVTLIISSPAYAADCKSFTENIEHALKLIALDDVGGMGDNSVPRATLVELKTANNLARIQINLQLMQASGCPLPKEPIAPSDYLSDALDCSMAELKGVTNPPACDLSKWVRQRPKETNTQSEPSSAPTPHS